MTQVNKVGTIIQFPTRRAVHSKKTRPTRSSADKVDVSMQTRSLAKLGYKPDLSRIEHISDMTCFTLRFATSELQFNINGALDYKRRTMEFDIEFTSLQKTDSGAVVSRLSMSLRFEQEQLALVKKPTAAPEEEVLGGFVELLSAIANIASDQSNRKRVVLTLGDEQAMKVLKKAGPQVSRDLMALVLYVVWTSEINARTKPVAVYDINVEGNKEASNRINTLVQWSRTGVSVEVMRFEAIIDYPEPISD